MLCDELLQGWGGFASDPVCGDVQEAKLWEKTFIHRIEERFEAFVAEQAAGQLEALDRRAAILFNLLDPRAYRLVRDLAGAQVQALERQLGQRTTELGELDVVDAVRLQFEVLQIWEAFEDFRHLLGGHGLALVIKEQFARAEPQGLQGFELQELVLHIVEAFDLHPVLRQVDFLDVFEVEHPLEAGGERRSLDSVQLEVNGAEFGLPQALEHQVQASAETGTDQSYVFEVGKLHQDGVQHRVGAI